MQDIEKSLAELTGKSMAELKAITDGLAKLEPLNRQMSAEAGDSERCASVGVLKVVDIGLCADLKLDGSDWHVNYRAKISLFGNEVWSEGGTLDKDHSSVTFKIDLVAMKASFTIGLEDFTHFCPFIDWDGKVYLPIWGWESKHIHQQMFCLR